MIVVLLCLMFHIVGRRLILMLVTLTTIVNVINCELLSYWKVSEFILIIKKNLVKIVKYNYFHKLKILFVLWSELRL